MLAHQGAHFFPESDFHIPEDFAGHFFSNFGVSRRTDFPIFHNRALGFGHVVQQGRVKKQGLFPLAQGLELGQSQQGVNNHARMRPHIPFSVVLGFLRTVAQWLHPIQRLNQCPICRLWFENLAVQTKEGLFPSCVSNVHRFVRGFCERT